MKRLILLLALAPIQAFAMDDAIYMKYGVEGSTIFAGAATPIASDVSDDFPRYDVDALCKIAWPNKTPAGEAAREVCALQQTKLASAISYKWESLAPPARLNCVKRANDAKYGRYSVLYACVNAGLFTQETRGVADNIAKNIQAQSGGKHIDRQPVGSIH
jgi:hypothetical protein